MSKDQLKVFVKFLEEEEARVLQRSIKFWLKLSKALNNKGPLIRSPDFWNTVRIIRY